MPPRPRPKPKTATSTPKTEDSFFLNNLTTQSWKTLSKRSEEATVVGNEDDSPRKNKKKSNHVVPSWTLPNARPNSMKAPLQISDDDDLYLDDSDDSTSRARRLNRSPKKAKHRKSRSRSLTPPPKLTSAQTQNVKNVVRTTLADKRRPPSPTVDDADKSTDSFQFMNDDLASAARNAAQSRSFSRSHSTPVGDDVPTVSIKIRWKPHPLDKVGQAKVLGFKIKRNDTFRQIFDEIADEFDTLVRDVVLTHNGRKIYSSVTPTSVDIWSEGELDACSQQTYNYMRENKMRFNDLRSPSPGPSTEPTLTPSDEGESDSDDDDDGVQEAAAGGSDTFKLTLRSAKTQKDIVLTVRPSTKCGSIVKAFLKKAGLGDKYLEESSSTKANSRKRGRKSLVVAATGPTLMVDGDKMSNDTEIAEADLEDGDMVEVVGL